LTVEALEDRLTPSGVDVVPGDPKDWPMYNHDPEGTRNNTAETVLSPATVGNLGVRWTFPTAGPIAGTPAVVNDHIYAADATGVVYALDRDGHLLWQTSLAVGPTFSHVKITASALVTNRTVIIGDLSGQIHGLDVDTGAEKWTIRPNPHPFASIWGSATMVGNDVAIGTASVEEFVAPFLGPGYHPSFRGSLVLLDPADGHTIWQTSTISDAEHAAGSSGSPIWSTPTYDQATKTIYVTTGNNYSQPTQGTSDSFIAFDAATGAIKWVNQRTADDEWTFAFGESSGEHQDFDIGDSPQLYKLGGRTVVSAGQKSGFFHVLDAATGVQVSSPIQLAPSGTVGGLFADSAYANGVVFANGTDWPGLLSGQPPNRGILSAVAADGSHELWHFDTPFSPNISGTAVANGVVYFQSMLDGTFYALDAASGRLLAHVATGGESSGPAVSRGQIYLGTGDSAFPFLNPTLPLGGGSIIALGLGESPSALGPNSLQHQAAGCRSTPAAASQSVAAGGSVALSTNPRAFTNPKGLTPHTPIAATGSNTRGWQGSGAIMVGLLSQVFNPGQHIALQTRVSGGGIIGIDGAPVLPGHFLAPSAEVAGPEFAVVSGPTFYVMGEATGGNSNMAGFPVGASFRLLWTFEAVQGRTKQPLVPWVDSGGAS
jgi:polyvinyl alcohol dehydrogenase (cytochrome)